MSVGLASEPVDGDTTPPCHEGSVDVGHEFKMSTPRR